MWNMYIKPWQMPEYDQDTPDFVKIANEDDISQWTGLNRWFSM